MEEGSTGLVNAALAISPRKQTWCSWHWHIARSHGKGRVMRNDNPRPPARPSEAPPARAGGIFMALGTLGGTIIGGLLGQPSMGFLAGLGGGFALHGLLWYLDSRRR